MARWQNYYMLPSSGADFELYVATLLEDLGYEVKMTPQTRDFGADLVIRKPSSDYSICVQAKFYSSVLDGSSIQEVVASLPYYGAQEGWVVTNSTFTQNAKTLAHANHVRLIDNDELNKLIQLALSGEEVGTKSVGSFSNLVGFKDDELLKRAAEIVVSAGVGSASNIQRGLSVTYSEAESLLNQLEIIGVVGAYSAGRPREVLVDSVELAALIGSNNNFTKSKNVGILRANIWLIVGVLIILFFIVGIPLIYEVFGKH